MQDIVQLDRKRSHGTVYGDPNIGFVQDEKNYRPDGTLYVAPVTSPAPAASPSKAIEPGNPVSEERRTAQSEAMKKVWAERRDALAQQRLSESPVES